MNVANYNVSIKVSESECCAENGSCADGAENISSAGSSDEDLEELDDIDATDTDPIVAG